MVAVGSHKLLVIAPAHDAASCDVGLSVFLYASLIIGLKARIAIFDSDIELPMLELRLADVFLGLGSRELFANLEELNLHFGGDFSSVRRFFRCLLRESLSLVNFTLCLVIQVLVSICQRYVFVLRLDGPRNRSFSLMLNLGSIALGYIIVASLCLFDVFGGLSSLLLSSLSTVLELAAENAYVLYKSQSFNSRTFRLSQKWPRARFWGFYISN